MKTLGFTGAAAALLTGKDLEAIETAQAVDRRGPLRASRFSVDLEIDGTTISGWNEIELPTARITGAEYRNGDEPSQDRQLWGRTEYDPLVMRRGIEPEGEQPITGDELAGTVLFDWFEMAQLGILDSARQDVKVSILNAQGEAAAGYLFHHAWPVAYHPPTLDAEAEGEIAMEALTLAYHWYERADP